MRYFNQSFLDYFAALNDNNTTAWFDANRRWYEKEVKIPFQEFIDELIVQLKGIDPDINIEPADAIFRINSDIRYTKEKIPYKPWMTANISAIGKRSKEYPGFFIQMNHERFVLAGGSYNPDKDTLYHIRQHILHDPHSFANALHHDEFCKFFGHLEGDQHKLLQEDFRSVTGIAPEIAYKQFYYRRELPPEMILAEDLPTMIRKYFETARPLHLFLRKAFKLPLAA